MTQDSSTYRSAKKSGTSLNELSIESGANDTTVDVIKGKDMSLVEKGLKRKIDWRILGYLTPLYLLFNLDRANIAYARLFGIEKALNLDADQYALTLSILYIGYFLFEIPSNLLIKIISPPLWISIIIVSCGFFTLCTAFVTNFASVITVRFFLGLSEAGFFPGVVYLMGLWYTRQEQGFRIALVSSASTFSGVLGGPLAYLISQLDGTWGLSNWQWLFVVEGIPTIILGIFAYWIIPGSPKKVKWIDEEERGVLLKRLANSHVEMDSKKFNKIQFLDAIKDYKTYIYISLFFGSIVPTTSVGQLMPTIINDLGFSTEWTLWLTAPPYILSLFLKLIMSWNSDRTMQRCYHVIGAILISITGFILQVATNNFIIRYLGINLSFAGAVTCIPLILSWSNNNMIGSTKAPTVVAMIIMVGGLGGFVGTQLYKPNEAPLYLGSNLVNIGILLVGIVIALFLRYRLIIENKKLNELDSSKQCEMDSKASMKNFQFVL